MGTRNLGAGENVLLGSTMIGFSLRHVGMYTPIILLFCIVAVRTVFGYEREQMQVHAETEASR